MLSLGSVLREALGQRRSRLSQIHPQPVLLWSGQPIARNFPANLYPFRANSHFLYFAGLPLADAVLALEADNVTLYWDEPTPEDEVWHGPSFRAEEVAIALQCDQVCPRSALRQWQDQTFVTLSSNASAVAQEQQQLGWYPTPDQAAQATTLAQAIIALRLQQDEAAIAQIRQAVAVTVEAHQAGMKTTRHAQTEAQVRAAIESVFMAHDCVPAYGSIVTTHGEVLHNSHYHHSLEAGDLLLVDAGAETPLGWASDVTRTWPVSGQFTPTQRAIYEIVLAAHDAAIAAIKPDVEYQQIHLTASEVMAVGLKEIGILQGSLSDLLEQEMQAYFFPHGVGHLLGLDVHDMEDFGDLAGYAPGRTRSDRPSLRFLRLNRPIQENMVVTIEPGFYQISGLIQAAQRSPHHTLINWDRLAEFSDVRGIRIEDDVRVNETGAEILTADLPTQGSDLEAIILGA